MHGTIYEFETLPRAAALPAASVAPRRARARTGAAPLVGIVRNPRSHRNKGRAAEFSDRPNILTRTPRTRAELRIELSEFARRGIDYLVIDGGDGTVRDVLTCGEPVFGGRWPRLIVLPKGKTNALAVDLGLPNQWSLSEALDAAAAGRTVERRPLAVRPASSASDPAGSPDALVQGFILGAGVFTIATQAAQEAHRRGAFNSFAVLLTIVWALIQTLFGGAANAWRAGTRMRLTFGGKPVPHSGRGSESRRFLLLASTLQRFPLGIRPFGTSAGRLNLAVLDAPLRRVIALVPLLAVGLFRSNLDRLGIHRVASEQAEIELGDRFILDGEYFPAGRYRLNQGSPLRFVTP